MRGIWRRASDRPRWVVETAIGILMLPLSLVPIWAYMSKTDDGFLMYLRGRYALLAPATPAADAATVRLASSTRRTRVIGVPVLVYHGLGRTSSDLADDRYVVPRDRFAQHMWALRLAGFTPIDTGTLAQYIETGAPELLPRKPILITFDDGRADAMIQADTILRDTRMKATMFVIGAASSGFTFYYESWKSLRRFARNGRWELANHTYGLHRSFDDVKGRHPISALVNLEPDESLRAYEARIAADLGRMQVALRTNGSTTAAFAYPYGDWGQHARSPGVADALQHTLRRFVRVAFDQDEQAGWRYALPQDDPLHIHRLEVANWTAAELLERLRAASVQTRTTYRSRGLDVPYRPRLLAAAAARTVCPPPVGVPLYSGSAAFGKVVALTFDGGPSVYTPQVLDELREQGAHATFFVNSETASASPRLLWRMVLDGNEIGAEAAPGRHGEPLLARLRATQTAIVRAARVRPCVSRASSRDAAPRHAAVAARLGLTTAVWSVDPGDHATDKPGLIARRVLRDVRPGSVVVLHDGGSNRWATVQALRPILRGLQQHGYRTVTVTRLRQAA